MTSQRMRRRTVWTVVAALALQLAALAPVWAAEKIVAMIGHTLAGESLDMAIAAFTEQTGIEVERIGFANWDELREKLPTMVAGGIPPDAVYHDSGAQADLYHRGVLQPIDEFVARDNFDLSLWPPQLLDAYTYGGRLYSLPTGVSNFVVFYNAAKMYEAGLTDLPTDWDQPGFTFNDLLEMARKLTRDADGDGAPEQYGLTDFLSRGAQGIHMWGLDWINDDQTEFIGNSSAHLEAVLEMRQLWEYGVVGGNWLNGTSILMPMQPYYLNTIATTMGQSGLFEWKIGILPTVECRCAPSGFHSMGMAAGAKNPEGAWKFIKFIATDPVGSVHFSRAENRTPVVPASIADFYDRWEGLNPGMNAHVFTSGLNYILNPKWAGLPRPVFNNLYSTMTQIVLGQKDPRLGLEELKPVIDAILKEMHEQRAQR